MLNFIGLETGDLNEFSGLSGTRAIESSTVKHGSYSFRVNPTTTATGSGEFRGLAATGAVASWSEVRLYVGS